MSKIYKGSMIYNDFEELKGLLYQIKCIGVVGKTVFNAKRIDEITNNIEKHIYAYESMYRNQQPQLSEEVKINIEKLEDDIIRSRMSKTKRYYALWSLSDIKQHIQEQASEIERLKLQNKQYENYYYMSIARALNNHTKLEVQEIYDFSVSDLEFAKKQIKSILGDE